MRNLPPRLAELARRWESLKLLVGRASVRMDMAFHRSFYTWHSDEVSKRKEWSLAETGDLYSPHAFHETTTSVLVGGDCRAKLTLQNGGLVHVYGDLSSTIEIGNHGEIVIGGSLSPGAVIESDGIHQVFVRGDLNGTIRSLGSLEIWVCGDFGGHVSTGSPITDIYVAGDVTGQIAPANGPSLLYMEVDSFVPYETLTSIARLGYIEFNASIGSSDQPPGIYPADRSEMAKRSDRCCWTIHRTRASPWDLPQDFGSPEIGD
jgi:hypothetical protein